MDLRGYNENDEISEIELNEEDKSTSAFGIKKLVVVSSIVAFLFAGSTYAANISIGSSSGNEFGQGVQITGACDPSIALKPTATFMNDVPVQDNYVTQIDLTGISQQCQGKLFIIRAYAETGTPLQLGPVNFPVIKFAMDGSSWKNYDAGCNQIDPYSNSQNGENSYIRLKMTDCPRWYDSSSGPMGRPLHSADTHRFTIETRENTMVRVDLTSSFPNGNIGWTLQNEEGFLSTWLGGGYNVPIFFDTSFNNYFEFYIKISNSDFINSSIGPNLVSLSTSSSISCSYIDKTPGNSPISSGPFQGRNSPDIDAVRFGCTAAGDGSVTAS